MNILEQVLNLPGAYFWLPGLVFVSIVGGVYWLTKGTPSPLAEIPGAAAPHPIVAAKPKDQRGMFRRHGNPVEVHVAAPEHKDTPAIGSVLDRSMGGVRLALFQEVEVGTVLAIRPVHVDSMVPWIDVEIRSCRKSSEMPDQFEVGCQYVKSPPFSIQLLFG